MDPNGQLSEGKLEKCPPLNLSSDYKDVPSESSSDIPELDAEEKALVKMAKVELLRLTERVKSCGNLDEDGFRKLLDDLFHNNLLQLQKLNQLHIKHTHMAEVHQLFQTIMESKRLQNCESALALNNLREYSRGPSALLLSLASLSREIALRSRNAKL